MGAVPRPGRCPPKVARARRNHPRRPPRAQLRRSRRAAAGRRRQRIAHHPAPRPARRRIGAGTQARRQSRRGPRRDPPATSAFVDAGTLVANGEHVAPALTCHNNSPRMIHPFHLLARGRQRPVRHLIQLEANPRLCRGTHNGLTFTAVEQGIPTAPRSMDRTVPSADVFSPSPAARIVVASEV